MAKSTFFVMQTIKFGKKEPNQTMKSESEIDFDVMAKYYEGDVKYQSHSFVKTAETVSIIVSFERTIKAEKKPLKSLESYGFKKVKV